MKIQHSNHSSSINMETNSSNLSRLTSFKMQLSISKYRQIIIITIDHKTEILAMKIKIATPHILNKQVIINDINDLNINRVYNSYPLTL